MNHSPMIDPQNCHGSERRSRRVPSLGGDFRGSRGKRRRVSWIMGCAGAERSRAACEDALNACEDALNADGLILVSQMDALFGHG